MRLTERDMRALCLLASVRVVRSDDLAVWLAAAAGRSKPLGERTVRGVVRRWELAGLVERHRFTVRGGAVIAITRAGLSLCGVKGLGRAAGVPPLPYLSHELTVSALALAYDREGWSWSSGWEIEEAPRPDGVVVRSGLSEAIEVELTAKSWGRYGSIIPPHLAHFGSVVYYAAPAALKVVSRWCANELTSDERARVSVREVGGWLR